MLNLKVVLHLAKILSLSSVRAKRAKGSVPTGAAKSPRVNLLFFGVAFPVVALLAYHFASAFLKDIPVATFFMQFSIFLPSLMALAAIMFGILFDVYTTGSTDMINWLPLRPSEYVLASTLALTYFLAPMLALFFGATFGIALSLNLVDIWLVSLSFGLLGMFSGTFLTEILRAVTNRVSATFYKRSGRTGIAVRTLAGIIVLVAFILIFNVNVLLIVLQQFVGGVSNAWFIPTLWPSLAILSYLIADTVQIQIYTILTFGFTLSLLWASVKLRAKYWEPIPVSIQLAPSKPYTPKLGILGRLGFTAAESAVIRKDFRGLTRRKEMLGWIAIPIAMGVIPLITSYSAWAAATTTIGKLTFFLGPLFGIVMLAFYLALIGVGQEGSAFINLLVAPLQAKEIAKAKLTTALFPATGALAVLLAAAQLLIQPRLEVMLALTVVFFAVGLEAGLVGGTVGSRFPDFTEVPRARFVTRQGAFFGMLLLGGSVGATLLPLFLYVFVQVRILRTLSLLGVTGLTAFIAIAICYVSYRVTVRNVQKFVHPEFTEVPKAQVLTPQGAAESSLGAVL